MGSETQWIQLVEKIRAMLKDGASVAAIHAETGMSQPMIRMLASPSRARSNSKATPLSRP